MTPEYMRDAAADLFSHLHARFPNLEPVYWDGKEVRDSEMRFERSVAKHMAWLLDQVPRLIAEQKAQELAWILGTVQAFLWMTGGLRGIMHLELCELDGQIQFVQTA